MERFLRLAREIHRRSLWQVLVIHLVGAWIGYEAAGALAGHTRLPEWFPEFTLALLLLGAPVTVTTAYVQGGLPGSRRRESDEHTRLEQVFNWRNAILGGILAFLLCIIVGMGWLVLAEDIVAEFH